MTSGQAESGLGLGEGNLVAGIQIGHSNDHRAHEGALLRSLLEIGHGLHDGDPAASAGEQHGPMGLGSVSDHTTRIDLEISQRDQVFGEFHAQGHLPLGLCGPTIAPVKTEANMSQLEGVVSHHEREIVELRGDRELAVAYLKAAMESLDDPDERAAGLLALRTVAEAHGGLGAVAAEAGISRESLYRSLSPKGNQTLKTLLAVLKIVGMRLSVEPEHHVNAR